MTCINILFDELYDDVDIIMVPDEIACSIKELVRNFLDWIPPDDDEYGWCLINGKRCINKETMGFVKWLNSNYLNNEKAYVLKQHVFYCPQYPTVEF